MTAEPCPHCGGTAKVHRATPEHPDRCPGMPPPRSRYKPKPLTLADTLASLRARWHQLLEHARGHHLDDYTSIDYTPVPVDTPPQLLTVSQQLGGLLLVVQSLAHDYPPAVDAALQMHTDVQPLLHPAAFIAPRTVSPPRPIALAIERLKAAGALPVTEATLAQGGELGTDARLVWFWLRTLDDA